MTTITPPRGYDWSFVGLAVHQLIMIRTFAIYVNDTIIAGAFVRGTLGTPPARNWPGVSATEPVADLDREDIVGRRTEQ